MSGPLEYKINRSKDEIKKNNISFYKFITSLRVNQVFLLAGIMGSILIWILFKTYYPNANLIFDSYHYLISTHNNFPVYAWPIGYPQFIRLVGSFSHSIFFFVSLQYFLLEISFLLFFFTIRYFLKLGFVTSALWFILFHLNPIFVYTANLIISDTLFVTLSLLWISKIIWILIKPKGWMIYTHAILLLLTFMVRYNALYYPLISSIAFIFCDKSVLFKLKGIAVSFLFVIGFIIFTSSKMETYYGVRQFSPFGGWKLANDALYIYEHVYKFNVDPIPQKYQELDKIVRNYFDRPHDTVTIFTPDVTSGSYYMYIYPSPLMKYMRKIKGPDPNPLNFKFFAPMGPLYQEYGTFLIKKYPNAFFTHFIIPNALRYIIPPQEVYTDNVNPFYLRNDALDFYARKWFKISRTDAPQSNIEFRYKIFKYYPFISMIVHIICILFCLSFIVLNGFKNVKREIRSVFIIIMGLLALDFTFSVIASAVVLRYEIFISIIEVAFTLLLFEIIVQIDTRNHPLMQS